MLSHPVAAVELQLALFTYPGCKATWPVRGAALHSGLPQSFELKNFGKYFFCV